MEQRKWVAALLALILACSLFPVMAFAEGEECSAGDSCTEHTAAIGTMHYTTLQEAINAALNNDEIKLLKGVTEHKVTFTKAGAYTLNLNGKTLTAGNGDDEIIAIKTPNLTLTIKNGTLASECTTTYGIYAYCKGGTAPAGDYADLNLLLDRVTINCVDQALGVQGNNSKQNVTVRNSKISCDTTGIYFPPKSGTLIVENSIVEAVNNGIVVKGGTVVIRGDQTKISASGTRAEQDKPYDGNTQGEGFPKTGNALYIEGNYSLNGAARPINVAIQGGTLESQNAFALGMNFVKAPDMQKAEVTGGVFSSNVTQFAAASATSASLTTQNGTTTYYVGTAQEIAARMIENAQEGDTISVLKGDLDLGNSIAGEVNVTNEGQGTVTVNGALVGTTESTTTCSHEWGAPVWNWAGNRESASATFTCARNANHKETVAANVDIDGYAGRLVYTATVAFQGQTYTDRKTVLYGDGEQSGVIVPGTPAPPATDDGAALPPQTGSESAWAAALACIFAGMALGVAVYRMRRRGNR